MEFGTHYIYVNGNDYQNDFKYIDTIFDIKYIHTRLRTFNKKDFESEADFKEYMDRMQNFIDDVEKEFDGKNVFISTGHPNNYIEDRYDGAIEINIFVFL